MKRNFEKIKLNKFSNTELEQRKLNALRGGNDCGCRCSCSCTCSCPANQFAHSLKESLVTTYFNGDSLIRSHNPKAAGGY